MLRTLPVVLGLVLIVGLAIVQGRWSDRWSDSATAVKDLVDRLDAVPTVVGDWEVAQDDSGKMDERVREQAGAIGHLSRIYKNKKTNSEVSVYLVCGHSRKITGHTPDKCYPGSGFTELAKQMKQPVPIDGGEAEFYTNAYRKETPSGLQRLRVFWCWAIDSGDEAGMWRAPDSPWRVYAGVQAMYKMYLISPIRTRKERAHESPCIDFAEVFIPEINKRLFPEPAAGKGTDEQAETPASDPA